MNRSNSSSRESSVREKRSTAFQSHYYTSHLNGADSDEEEFTRIDELNQYVHKLKFRSLFEAILIEARSDKDGLCEFVENGGLNELFDSYLAARKQRPGHDSTGLNSTLCAPAIRIFKTEWRKLIGRDTSFKRPLNQFSPKYIGSFSFDSIYNEMRSLAPCLLEMMNQITGVLSQGPEEEIQSNIVRARQRRIVVSISVLANFCTQQFNAIQGRVGYFLFGCKVTKRVLNVLNKLGICSSYHGLRDALRANAAAIRKRLSCFSLSGEAIWVSFDNLTYAANVRDHRLFNRGDFICSTAGYVVKPPQSQRRPMFTRANCDYRSAMNDLNIADFCYKRVVDVSNRHWNLPAGVVASWSRGVVSEPRVIRAS